MTLGGYLPSAVDTVRYTSSCSLGCIPQSNAAGALGFAIQYNRLQSESSSHQPGSVSVVYKKIYIPLN